MFKRLIIENFQAHRKLELDFDECVTTIVGPSDVGKSAVIRALTWLATNRPSGTEFIRDKQKNTCVTLEVDDHTITRERSKSWNRYTLDGKVFTAFGTEPPSEILTVLNLSDLNFQAQHDAPFWFQESAPEVSRQLNQIVDLSIIDSTLANLDKGRRDALAKVKALEQEVEDAATLRSSMAWAKKASEDLAEAVEYHTSYTEISEDRQRLINLTEAVSNYGTAQKNARRGAKSAENTVRIGEEWRSAEEERTKLDYLLAHLRTQDAIVSRPIPDLTPLSEVRTRWDKLSLQVKQLKDQINLVLKVKTDCRSKLEQAQELESEFKQQMGKVCPLCGNKL
jgi:exonuclease SbcC